MRRKTTPSIPGPALHNVSLSHAILLLESDVSPFLKRGNDHLRFPAFTLSITPSVDLKAASEQDVCLQLRKVQALEEKGKAV